MKVNYSMKLHHLPIILAKDLPIFFKCIQEYL